MNYAPGDKVECALTTDEQNARRVLDAQKAAKEGVSAFMGRAAAYMHTDHAYIVEAVTPNGGLRLRGFVPTVSPQDVRHSKMECR